MLDRAKELRREMTPQERKLWYMFLRTYPVKFYKQRIIESFIVDFYCHAAKLVVEIDGSQHYEPQGQAYDAERTAILEGYGLEVLRFSNRDINTDFRVVCEHIDNKVKRRLPHDQL
jgi:very-short-patch-repair endonuclease